MNTEEILIPIAYGEMTEDDEAIIKWAEEGVRNSSQVMYESIRQLLILVTALLSGSVAFLKDAVAAEFRIVLIFLLLVSLGACVWGVMPQEIRYRPQVISDARHERERLCRIKKWCLRVALIALALAGCSAFIGVVMVK